MKNRYRAAAIVAALAVAAVLAALYLVPADDSWEFVIEAEARSPSGDRSPSGEVLAMRQARASTCEPDGEGHCLISWDWAGESLPTDAEEWVKAHFVDQGHTIPVVVLPEWYGIDPMLCQAQLTCDGETVVVEPSEECLAALRERGLEPDGRGFWHGGTISGGVGSEYAFFEPTDLIDEWYGICPLPQPTPTPGTPPPTYTPRPTYAPEPTPTCRPTWTPPPAPTEYPTGTPYPTSTAYPPQPPWGQ